MRRREFIAALGGAATFAFAARADSPERVRRVGVLIFGAEDDPVTQTRVDGLRQGLQKAGLGRRPQPADRLSLRRRRPRPHPFLRQGVGEPRSRRDRHRRRTGHPCGAGADADHSGRLRRGDQRAGLRSFGKAGAPGGQQHRNHQSVSCDRRPMAGAAQGGGAAPCQGRAAFQPGVRRPGLPCSHRDGRRHLSREDDQGSGRNDHDIEHCARRRCGGAERGPAGGAAHAGLHRDPV